MAPGGSGAAASAPAPGGRPLGGPVTVNALAVGLVAVASAARLALAGQLDHVFLFFYPAVAVSAMVGGLGPGLLATVLSAAALALWLMPARLAGDPLDRADLLGLGLFVLLNAVLCTVMERYRRTRRRLAALERGAAREAQARLDAAEAGMRQRDAAAQLTRAQLEAVLAAMSDGVIVMDLERRPVLINEALIRVTGLPGFAHVRSQLPAVASRYTITTLDGHPVPPERWPLARALDGESVPAVELRARRDDTGQEWVFSFTCEPVRDEAGRQVLTVGVVRDISGRVAIEEAVARQRGTQDQLAAMALSVPGFVFSARRSADGSGAITFVSPAVKEVLGIDQAAMAAEPGAVRARIHPQDLPAVLASQEASARTLAPWHAEYRYLHPVKGPRWLEGRAVPRPEPDGSVLFHGFVTDVTDRREAQDAVRALAARLQAAREEEAARIARDLHDDLGQTLTALQLELRWVEARVERLPPTPEHGQLVDRLVAASELAAATLVTVQRLSQELHPVALDHLGLAAALRTELRRFEQRTGMLVVATLDADAPPGDARGTTLFRICQEALTNVARHAKALHVEVRLRGGPDGMVLTVADDGRGLPAGLTASPTSLGLLGMQERAHALGGEVTVEPGPRGGTVVTARIPWPGASS